MQNQRSAPQIDLPKPTSIKRVQLVLRAIQHPYRKQILRILAQKEELNVSELCSVLQLPQPIVSLHLAILRKAQFLVAERKGKQMMYSIQLKSLKNIGIFLSRIA